MVGVDVGQRSRQRRNHYLGMVGKVSGGGRGWRQLLQFGLGEDGVEQWDYGSRHWVPRLVA